MTNFIEATKIELKKRTPEELVDKITELATDKIVKDKEIARLNKIIDELEKTINECSILGEYESNRTFIEKDYLLNKLKELKEESKE